MAGLARRLAPAAALGGLAVVIVGVADPAIAGRTDATDTGTTSAAVTAEQGTTTQAAPDSSTDTSTDSAAEAPADTATCASGEEITGESVMTRWGPVQVVATVDGQQVCEVHAVAWPESDRKSQAINAYAIPELDAMASEVGTSFDYISGATYTSEAYRDSLQSILDAL